MGRYLIAGLVLLLVVGGISRTVAMDRVVPRTLRCQFQIGVVVTYDTAVKKFSTKSAVGNRAMVTSFDLIDINTRTARVISEFGANDVTVITGRVPGMTFYTRAPSGTIQFTTVYLGERKQTGQDKPEHPAISTLHVLPFVASGPVQQSFGSCVDIS